MTVTKTYDNQITKFNKSKIEEFAFSFHFHVFSTCFDHNVVTFSTLFPSLRHFLLFSFTIFQWKTSLLAPLVATLLKNRIKPIKIHTTKHKTKFRISICLTFMFVLGNVFAKFAAVMAVFHLVY